MYSELPDCTYWQKRKEFAHLFLFKGPNWLLTENKPQKSADPAPSRSGAKQADTAYPPGPESNLNTDTASCPVRRFETAALRLCSTENASLVFQIISEVQTSIIMRYGLEKINSDKICKQPHLHTLFKKAEMTNLNVFVAVYNLNQVRAL